MDTQLADWTALALRWLHVAAGVAWAGAILHHARLADRAPNGEGALWVAEGGGFFRLQCESDPLAIDARRLLWVRWEAYLAWASGFLLLAFVYYRWAEQTLVDPAVLGLSGGQAVTVGLCLLAAAWIVYDQCCRSALRRNEPALAALLVAMLVALAFLVTQLFSARGAFIHFGAVLATLMAANLAHHMVPAARERLRGTVDEERLARARQRSAHNGYLVFPVLFTMVSGHYTPGYGALASGFILAGIGLAGVALRALLARGAKCR